MLTHFSTFTGIGGIDRAAEGAGYRTVAQCEKEPFCRRVLARRFPGVPIFKDVRDVTAKSVRDAGIPRVFLLSGGVPCQPASLAGQRKGADDERWLWPEFLRLVRELRPVWVLAENPVGILTLKPDGFDWIADQLQEAGYEAQAFCYGASEVGASHERQRVFIVAHADGGGCGTVGFGGMGAAVGGRGDAADVPAASTDAGAHVADAPGRQFSESGRESEARVGAAPTRATVADADGAGSQELRLGESGAEELCASEPGRDALADAERERRRAGRGEPGDEGGPWLRRDQSGDGGQRWPAGQGQSQFTWEEPRTVEPPMGRSVDGLSRRLVRHRRDALKAYGNAVVPAQVYPVLRAIAEYEARK